MFTLLLNLFAVLRNCAPISRFQLVCKISIMVPPDKLFMAYEKRWRVKNVEKAKLKNWT